MPKPNISAVLSDADRTAIKTSVADARGKMPFLVNLDGNEKKKLFKMGPGSVSFVEECLRIAKNNPGILPGNFDVVEFEKDANLTSALSDIGTVLIPLAEGVDDTFMAVGSEAMLQANIVYAQVKLASKSNANMDELKQKLAERYKGQKKNPGNPPN